MSVLELVIVLLVLALLYWGTNTAPFIIGQFRAILSWLWVVLAVIVIVAFILSIFGVVLPHTARGGGTLRIW